MVEKRDLGRIEFGPEGKHTASRKNPYDAWRKGHESLTAANTACVSRRESRRTH